MDTETRVFINVAGTPIGCIQHLVRQLPRGSRARRSTIPALKELVLEGQFLEIGAISSGTC